MTGGYGCCSGNAPRDTAERVHRRVCYRYRWYHLHPWLLSSAHQQRESSFGFWWDNSDQRMRCFRCYSTQRTCDRRTMGTLLPFSYTPISFDRPRSSRSCAYHIYSSLCIQITDFSSSKGNLSQHNTFVYQNDITMEGKEFLYILFTSWLAMIWIASQSCRNVVEWETRMLQTDYHQYRHLSIPITE